MNFRTGQEEKSDLFEIIPGRRGGDRAPEAEESLGHGRDEVAHREAFAPLLGDAGLAVVGPGELAVDGAGGVGVVAEVDGQQRPFAERGAAVEGPEGGLERLDDVAGAADLGGLAAAERAGGDLGDPGASGCPSQRPGSGA